MKINTSFLFQPLQAKTSILAKQEGDGSPQSSTIVKLNLAAITQALSDDKNKEKQTGFQSGMLESMKQISDDMKNQKKAAARTRVQMIKQQIEGMLRFASALSPAVAKGVAGQIRQLAQQLRAAASVLMEGGGGSEAGAVNIPLNVGGESGAAATDGASADGSGSGAEGGGGEGAAAASTAAAAEAEAAEAAQLAQEEASKEGEAGTDAADGANGAVGAAGAEKKAEGESDSGDGASGSASGSKTGQPVRLGAADAEREADLKLLREVTQKLKVLFSLVRIHLQDDKNKDVKETQQALEDIDKMMSTGEPLPDLSTPSFNFSA